MSERAADVAPPGTPLVQLASWAANAFGIPLLLAIVGWGATQLMTLRDDVRDLKGERIGLAREVERVDRASTAGDTDMQRQLEAAVRRGEQARQAVERASLERDALHDKQLAELSGAVAASREALVRIGTQLESLSGSVSEVKGMLVQRPAPVLTVPVPQPPASRVDRLLPQGWSNAR